MSPECPQDMCKCFSCVGIKQLPVKLSLACKEHVAVFRTLSACFWRQTHVRSVHHFQLLVREFVTATRSRSCADDDKHDKHAANVVLLRDTATVTSKLLVDVRLSSIRRQSQHNCASRVTSAFCVQMDLEGDTRAGVTQPDVIHNNCVTRAPRCLLIQLRLHLDYATQLSVFWFRYF